MFTVVAGNNGRTIYVGKVIAKNDKALRLEGVEWDPNLQMEINRVIECKFDEDIIEKSKQIRVGAYLIIMVMPSKDDPDRGTCEEIGFIGEVLKITNTKGNEKKIALCVVRNNNRSKNGTSTLVSATNLKEYGKTIGTSSSYTGNDGQQHTLYWTTFIGCNSQTYSINTADKMERALRKGDLALFVYHESDGEYNGEQQTSRFVDKFALIYRNEHLNQQAQNNSQQSSSQNRTPDQVQGENKETQVPAQTEAPNTQGTFDSAFNMLSDEDLDDLPFN